jgi:hypothetical protein
MKEIMSKMVEAGCMVEVTTEQMGSEQFGKRVQRYEKMIRRVADDRE